MDTSPIATTPAALEDLDALWRAVVHETRTRGNDIHLPISLAFAERLCRAYPDADAELVRVATLLHDTGWAHVDESRIISEGFTGDWRKADIRYEHEQAGLRRGPPGAPGPGLLRRNSLSASARSSTATTPARWRSRWRTR